MQIVEPPSQHQDATITWLSHDVIRPSKLNPRTHFAEQKIAELELSFRSRGFDPALSHLLVRPYTSGPYRINQPGGPESRTWYVERETKHGGSREFCFHDLGQAEAKLAEMNAPKFELVCGERRWRAAGKAQLGAVPCVVRELTDAEVIELQLIENLQRDDLNPMEEAAGLQQYDNLLAQQQPGTTKEERYAVIAAKIGLESTRSVGHRLSLCKLIGSPAGAAIASGDLSPSHGRLLARLPDSVRADVSAKVLANPYGPSPMPRQQLEVMIRDDYQKELRGAPFDTADPDLVPEVSNDAGERVMGGSCGDCPFNTKNSEAERPRFSMCQQPGCYRAKEAASYDRWRASVTDEEKSRTALPAEANAALWDDSGVELAHNSGYIDLKQRPGGDEVKEGIDPPPWKKLIAGRGVPVILGRDAKGVVHELAPRHLVITAAEENDKEKPARDRLFVHAEKQEPITDDKAAEAALEQQRAAELARRIEAAQFAAVIEKAKSVVFPPGTVPLMLHALIASVDEHGDADEVVRRNGWDQDSEAADLYGDVLRKRAKKLDEPLQVALVVELLLMQYYPAERQIELVKWAKLLGADLKAARKTVEQAAAAENKVAAERAEIVEGLKWTRIRHGVEDFAWTAAGICEQPDKCELAFPKATKITAAVMVARSDKGWHAGWSVSSLKKGALDLCDRSTTHYDARDLAFRAGLLGVQQHLIANAEPDAALERIAAFVAMFNEPKKKGGAK